MHYLDTPKPRLFGHRGACGQHPENTLDSFAAALRDGAMLLELDVHASRDGVVVVIHDDTLARTTDGDGPVSARTLAEIERLDAGYRFGDAAGGHPFRGKGLKVPTLAEVLEAFPDTPLNVEIKQHEPAIEEPVLELLDACGARDRVLLAAEDHRIMLRIRELARGMLTGFSAVEVAEFVSVCAGDPGAYRAPGNALQVPPVYEDLEIVTPRFVAAAHELGLEVHVWTINDTRQMKKMLELGVDGLMTDFPARAAPVVAEYAS